MQSYSLSSSDKPSSKILFPFLAAHGFLFLGIGYIIFTTFPLFALVDAFLGIFVYLVFWRASFPRLFRDVLVGAALSVVLGIIFGDVLIDKFFFLYQQKPQGLIPKIYSATVVFYIYFYIRILQSKFKNNL